MEKILDGIRVVDLGRYISAPYCGQLLADAGAEVIKVEKKGEGDITRCNPPYKNGISLYTPSVNRGKKSVTLNFRTDKGKELLRALVEKADVFLANFRPGTLNEMGFGYEDVVKYNPSIVMVEISGFGQEGTYKHKAAFDGIAMAMSGIMATNATKDGPKHLILPFGDVFCSINAAYAIVLSLYNRKRTGKGQYIDFAMVDALVPLLTYLMPLYEAAGANTGEGYPIGQSADPLHCPCNIYRCCDGNVGIFADIDGVFADFARGAGLLRLEDGAFVTHEGRIENYAECDGAVAAWCKTKTMQEVQAVADKAGISCAAVNNIGSLMKDPHAVERGLFPKTTVDGIGQVAFFENPVKMKTRDMRTSTHTPELGENNAEVYGRILGMSEGALAQMKNEGDI